MYVGWGVGQRAFLGYGARIQCSHCSNCVVEQIFVTYSYEEAMFIRWKHLGDRGSQEGDGAILFLCPTCMHGFKILGSEAAEREKKNIAKTQGGVAAAAFGIQAIDHLSLAQSRFDITYTKNWVANLNVLRKRSYFKLLRRAGLHQLAQKLDN
jgi:hypothetical protein